MTDEVMFDLPKYRRLQRAHAKAVRQGKDAFVFEGREYLTDYAEYVLEYLDTMLVKEQ